MIDVSPTGAPRFRELSARAVGGPYVQQAVGVDGPRALAPGAIGYVTRLRVELGVGLCGNAGLVGCRWFDVLYLQLNVHVP